MLHDLAMYPSAPAVPGQVLGRHSAMYAVVGMEMQIDEAWHDQFACAVDDSGGLICSAQLIAFAHILDPVLVDHDCTIRDNSSLRIHSEDRRVADHEVGFAAHSSLH